MVQMRDGCPECKKLARRIHNQRVRLRQLETFGSSPSYYRKIYKLYRDYATKLSKELWALRAPR